MKNLEGIDGIREVLERALENKEKLLRSALAGKPLVYFVDKEFANEYMNKRKEQGISLKSLRFSQGQHDLPEHQDYASHKKEVRNLLTKNPPQQSVLIWDDSVAFVDTEAMSTRLVTDVILASAMKGWFDMLWERSEKSKLSHGKKPSLA